MGWNGLALSSDLKICFTRNLGRYHGPLSRLCFAYVLEWINLVRGIQKMYHIWLWDLNRIYKRLKKFTVVVGGGGGLFDFSVSLNQIYLNLD